MLPSRPLPKPVLLSEMLIREIAAGRLVDGSRLHTERQLAAHFNVAVGTLRKALSILEEKGMLERIQGSGNYVKSDVHKSGVYGFFRLELVRGGGFPSAKVISVERIEKEADMPDFGTAHTAHRVRRLRFLDDTPVALEEIWLDGRFNEEFSKEDLSDSLYYFYQKKFDLFIAHATDQVGVATVPNWGPDAFPLDSYEPCGFIKRVSQDQYGQPAEFSRTWFDASLANYTIRHR